MCEIIYRSQIFDKVLALHGEDYALANFHENNTNKISYIRRNKSGIVEYEPNVYGKIFDSLLKNLIANEKEHRHEKL